jgi:rubrerythrin
MQRTSSDPGSTTPEEQGQRQAWNRPFKVSVGAKARAAAQNNRLGQCSGMTPENLAPGQVRLRRMAAWLGSMMRRMRRTAKNPEGVPDRKCAICGHEVVGTGPEPEKCPTCGNRWRSS